MRETISVTVDQFTRSMGVLMAEASDLGLVPGEWPNTILVANSRGAVEKFRRHCSLKHCDEGGFVYVGTHVTTELHIIND